MARPVCLITGVGPGTGASLARRFHSDYDIAMLARNAERLDALADALPNAYAYPCEVTDREALAETIARVRAVRGAGRSSSGVGVWMMVGVLPALAPDIVV